MRDLRANGVQQITGDLVLDRSFFIQPQLPEFNDDGNDENKPFLVKPDSLLVNLKALRFVARNDGGRVLVSVEPPIASIRIENQVKAVNTKQCAGGVRYNPVPQADGSVTVTVGGQLGDGCSSQTYLSLLDHATYTAGAVRAIWKELGGSIQGRTAWPLPRATPRCWPGHSLRTWRRSSATSTNTVTTPWPSNCS